MRSVPRLLGVLVLCAGCASSDAKSHAPKRETPPDPNCQKAYKPPVCLGDQLRCETDDKGCETCTCDQTTAAPPGH